MIGVALEGGAERSSFTAGVMDALMAHDFYAGAASGTSAGAGCVLNYRSGQQGVALEMMIMERHSRYFGIRHMAHTGRFLNLDHMAHEYASRISWDAYRHPSMQTDLSPPAARTASRRTSPMQAASSACLQQSRHPAPCPLSVNR